MVRQSGLEFAGASHQVAEKKFLDPVPRLSGLRTVMRSVYTTGSGIYDRCPLKLIVKAMSLK
jgi:hypothetical protein